jgi:hypothetical protein
VPPVGAELAAKTTAKTQTADQGNAESDALRTILDAFHALPAELRQAFLERLAGTLDGTLDHKDMIKEDIRADGIQGR